MPTCIVCRGEYSTTDTQCSKCGVDNKYWETERTRSWVSRALQFFGGVWGVLALTSLALPLVSIVAYDYIQLVASVRIGVPLAIILCFVIFLFTYALRFSAREYELLRQVRKGWRPTLALMALLAFNMALAVAFVLAAYESPPAHTTGLARALMTICLSLTFVNLTLSAMLMSIRSFAKRLNELVPRPIFLQSDLLVYVLIKSAQEQLKGKTTLSLLEMSRTDEGGIRVLVQDSAQEKQQWEGVADAWGNLISWSSKRSEILAETARRFFQAAGFELIPSEEETSFLCQPRDEVWQEQFSQPIPVRVVFGTPLDADTVYALCQSTRQALDGKPTVAFVVIDHTPTDSGWLQIGTMRAEGVQVIPIDDAVLFEGQERGRQRQVLEKHLSRFLRQRDFYNVRHPVADRLSFFGREAPAGELMELLTEGCPLALFGLRKMGKSSLLMYLRDKLSFPTALVDLQAGVELGGLYGRILTSWSRSIRVKVRDLDWPSPNLIEAPDLSSTFTAATRQLLTWLEDHNVPPRLCLLVDETEWIVPRNGEGLESYLSFARALRGLVQEEEGRFSLLMAGVNPLFNRVNRLAGQQNPFYQFFREVYLPSLERDDCIQMIRNIGQQMGLNYSDEAVAFVADVSGGHPFLARQLCSLAFQQLGRSGDVPLSHLQEIAMRFIREPGTSELLDEKGLWGEISDPDLWPQPQVVENQAVLKSLAQTEPQPESDLLKHAQDRRACERSLDELERRAVLGKSERTLFNIRLRLFRNWIRRYQLGGEVTDYAL